MSQAELARGAGPSYRWRDDPFLAWRAATYSALFVLAALAWWETQSRVSGMGMSMGPGTVAFFMVTWVVMMAAMMFPSVAPMVATYVSDPARADTPRRMPAPAGASLFFVGGYLLSWSAGAVCSAYLVLRIGEQLTSDPMFWQGQRSLGGGGGPGRRGGVSS